MGDHAELPPPRNEAEAIRQIELLTARQLNAALFYGFIAGFIAGGGLVAWIGLMLIM